MPDPRYLEISGKIKRETEKALHISFINGRQEWIPKSTITSNFSSDNSIIQKFIIAKWFAEKKNLVLEAKNVNILGESGSEEYLKHSLLRKGLKGFDSFKDIQYFKRNFSKILKMSTEEERTKLNSVIEVLKSEEERLKKELDEKKSRLKNSLIKEKEELIGKDLNSKGKRRLKKIEKTLKKKLEKPFKKDVKQIKKTEKEQFLREKNLEKSVENSVKSLHKAHDIIEDNRPSFAGAIGETAVIRELRHLPETYYILNEVMLSFSRSIMWKKYYEYVKSCKIDHVVVGPTGIFLIETKNWSPQTLRNARFTPHKQIDRAGYIFFIHMMDQFNRKFPSYNVVATYKELPQIPYKYVEQLTIRELINHIIGRKVSLNPSEILKIVAWLRSSPFIYNSKRKLFKLPRRRLFRWF